MARVEKHGETSFSFTWQQLLPGSEIFCTYILLRKEAIPQVIGIASEIVAEESARLETVHWGHSLGSIQLVETGTKETSEAVSETLPRIVYGISGH